MKVLHVIDRLNIGGAEKVFVDIIHLLADAGIEVGALLFEKGFPLDDQIDKRVKTYVLNRKNKFSISKMYEAHKLCSRYNIVHVHMRHCYNYIRLVQLVFNGSYKVILHDHFGDIEINRSIPKGWSSIFKPAYYIGVSHPLTEWAKEYLKMPAANVFLLTNTIRPGSFKHQPGKTSAVCMVSNIRPTKNIEFAINLFSKKHNTLAIYGNRSDAAYYAVITNMAEGNASISIIEGEKELTAVYNKYAMAIHCARSETGPLVLLEYLAYGVPFLMYKTGEIANVVSKELPQCFIDNFNEDDWNGRIDEIMKSDLSSKLIEIFNNHFSPQQYIKQCLDIYQSVSC